MQNICGVSVVDHRFEELKRYNIAEIFDPTPQEANKTEVGERAGKEAKAEAVVTDEAVAEADVKDEAAEANVKDESAEVVAEGDDGGAKVEATRDDLMVEGDGGVSVVKDQAGDETAADEGGVSGVKD